MEVKRFTTFSVSGKRVESMARIAIVGEPGRKYTELVYLNGASVVLRKIANAEAEQFCTPVKQGKKGLARTARQLLGAGKRFGITKGAKKFLKAVIESERAEIEKLV